MQALFILGIVFIFLYVYFVQSAIFSAVAKTKIEAEALALETSLSSLEGRYLQKTSALTMSHALSLGFERASDDMVRYVSLDSDATLSFRSADR